MYVGIDIGGTKTAVILATVLPDGKPNIEKRVSFATSSPKETIERVITEIEEMKPFSSIGISCGGPLDEERGIIMSPPNLPGWDNIKIVDMLKERFGVPAAIRNDANACALAEWRFGAGVGTKNMVFLTFGTGLGAGLILDGKLYSGTNGNAGEVGHIRLADDGPVGYGKRGSFEGFCSGGGIAELGKIKARAALLEGREILGCKTEGDVENLTAKSIAEMAQAKDADAIAVYSESATKLGEGLSIIIDTLNPEAIVIGSVYERSEKLFAKAMNEVLSKEALKESLGACRVLPARLGNQIGDYAAISVAVECKQECANTANLSYTDNLIARYPALAAIRSDIEAATSLVLDSYRAGGKVLLCGNGGSCADSEHVAGELLKGFMIKREPTDEEMTSLTKYMDEESARKLQRAIPAIPLPSITGTLSAFANDVDAELVYAQLVFGLGNAGDVLFAFSTSGNSKNVLAAVKVAKARGVKTVAFTGKTGGKLLGLADVCICAPETETYKVQEYHLPIYHAICQELEHELFEKN